MKLASNKIKKLYATAVCNGPRALIFRIGYELHRKLGLLKRKSPIYPWSELDINRWVRTAQTRDDILQELKSDNIKFFFKGHSLPKFIDEEVQKQTISRAEDILNNRFEYFFNKTYFLGQGPEWFLNPETGKCASSTKHWTETVFYDPEVGDIKYIWEPSRFAWAYTLVRAYALTGQEIYADKFWSLLESWLENNQPNLGPNYACGQECAIRLMAMCFALYGFEEAKASSVERKTNLIIAIAFHAERIANNIDFAISTGTNHSLTEAAGLYTAGLLFPGLKNSNRWVKLGKRVLTREGLRQIYADGSYIQHSMNYHRLMLQDFLWVLRLAELNGDSFSKVLVSRVERATEFIYQMQDEQNGRVPNYGANDGSLILPLNSCDYLDFRPVIQSCEYLLKRVKLYPKGSWDEDLMWLFGTEALSEPTFCEPRSSSSFTSGGYYTLRSKNSWMMCRCHSYSSRVIHVDPLHIDLWAEGMNLLRDSGTYGYFLPKEPQLEFYFKSIWAHNAVIIDGAPPVKLVSRFMWWPLLKSKLLKFSKIKFEGELQGESPLCCYPPGGAMHRRCVTVKKGRWEITDEIVGQGKHNVELRWQVPAETRLIRSQPNSVQIRLSGRWFLEVNSGDQIEHALLRARESAGYESLYYGSKVASATLSVRKNGQLPIVFQSIVWKQVKAED